MQFDRLKEFMDFMARERTPGNSVMVYLHGEPVFRYVSGYSDWENLVPLRGDELFNIYSCSKVTTVTAAMQVVEQGKWKRQKRMAQRVVSAVHPFCIRTDPSAAASTSTSVAEEK